MFGLTPSNRKNYITPFNPFDAIDIAMQGFFGKDDFSLGYTSNIKVDVRETEKEYVVEAELPGVAKEDIEVKLKDGRFSIEVNKTESTDKKESNYILKERKSQSYSRVFYVENVKEDEIKAKYDSGILIVTLPKLQENVEKKLHKIEIE